MPEFFGARLVIKHCFAAALLRREEWLGNDVA